MRLPIDQRKSLGLSVDFDAAPGDALPGSENRSSRRRRHLHSMEPNVHDKDATASKQQLSDKNTSVGDWGLNDAA